jgi:hypothetical protein
MNKQSAIIVTVVVMLISSPIAVFSYLITNDWYYVGFTVVSAIATGLVAYSKADKLDNNPPQK